MSVLDGKGSKVSIPIVTLSTVHEEPVFDCFRLHLHRHLEFLESLGRWIREEGVSSEGGLVDDNIPLTTNPSLSKGTVAVEPTESIDAFPRPTSTRVTGLSSNLTVFSTISWRANAFVASAREPFLTDPAITT